MESAENIALIVACMEGEQAGNEMASDVAKARAQFMEEGRL